MLSINQADAPCSCECKCMKPECFRLASALTNTSPFKSSVPTAHTVEAISMHLPARDTDSVCTRTEMATCLSLLVPALALCSRSITFTSVKVRLLLLALGWSWLHHPRQNEVAETVIFTIASRVYYACLRPCKEQKRVSRNGDTWKSTPRILHQGSRNHSTKISHLDGDKWPNHSVGSTCPFYF